MSRPASESTLARIVHLVEEARADKARTQRFLEKAEQQYALGVILFTLGLIVVPWRLFGEGFDTSFYRAMTVVVPVSGLNEDQLLSVVSSLGEREVKVKVIKEMPAENRVAMA